jgi:hypothetical protein
MLSALVTAQLSLLLFLALTSLVYAVAPRDYDAVADDYVQAHFARRKKPTPLRRPHRIHHV